MLTASLQVLVVDDDLPIRETLRLVLEDAEYAVLTAQDGIEALDHLRSVSGPLVVLLDYVMPCLSGLEVLRTIAAEAELGANRVFVLCTAMGGSLPAEMQSLRAHLGVGLLTKPFDLDALLSTVAEAAAALLDACPSGAVAAHGSDSNLPPAVADCA